MYMPTLELADERDKFFKFWIEKHIRFNVFREATDERRDTFVQVPVEKRTFLSKYS